MIRDNDGGSVFAVVRHDGKECHLRKHRQTAKFDARFKYHEANDYHVEEVVAPALLWWQPRVKATEWEPYGK